MDNIKLNYTDNVPLYRSFDGKQFEGSLELKNIGGNTVVYRISSSKEGYLNVAPTLNFVSSGRTSIISLRILREVSY